MNMIDHGPSADPGISAAHHSSLGRLLHWVTALLVLIMFATHWLRDATRKDPSLGGYLLSTHESVGVTVLMLTIWRVLRRLSAHPAGSARSLSDRAAGTVQALLCLLLIGLPLAGLVRLLSDGKPLSVFGLIISNPIRPDHGFHVLGKWLHGGFATSLLLVLIGGHATAALWHECVMKDGRLRRMLSGRVP